MKIIGKIATIICAIAAVGGIIASAIDLLQRRRCEKQAKEKGLFYHKTNGIYERYLKRFFDFFLSSIALIVLSPLMAVTAILVRIKLGSPVLFIQKRPGKDGKIFSIYKFRTMTDERDADGNLLSDEIRLTSFGKLLRSTSIDELPELINIVKSDMSIVGPRPLLVEYLERYNEKQKHRHDVKPGLTGLAQVSCRNGISCEDKFYEDIEYINNITLINDIKILLKTIVVVLNRSGISSESSVTMEEFKGNI